MRCPKCKEILSDTLAEGQDACPSCGASWLRHCPSCGAALRVDAVYCPKCEPEMAPRDVKLPEHLTARADARPSPPPRSHGTLITLVALFLLALVYLYATVHVVATRQGTVFVRKVSWSFGETFVNLDAIQGTPYLVAKARWPLAVAALQRDGYLETEEQFQARVKREVEAEMQRAAEEQQRQLDQTMRALGYR